MNDEIVSVPDDFSSSGVLVDFEQAETVTSTFDPVTVNVFLPVAAEPVEVEEEEQEAVQFMSLSDDFSSALPVGATLNGWEPPFYHRDGQSIAGIWDMLFGTYTPACYQYRVQVSDSSFEYITVPIPGVAGLDFSWIASTIFLLILTEGVFSFLRVLFKKS